MPTTMKLYGHAKWKGVNKNGFGYVKVIQTLHLYTVFYFLITPYFFPLPLQRHAFWGIHHLLVSTDARHRSLPHFPSRKPRSRIQLHDSAAQGMSKERFSISGFFLRQRHERLFWQWHLLCLMHWKSGTQSGTLTSAGNNVQRLCARPSCTMNSARLSCTMNGLMLRHLIIHFLSYFSLVS